jgi:predicted acylesterase/phospholipase RssA
MTIRHLVIPGGGPTGFQALGALQELEQTGFWKIEDIKTIYATSVGTIISVLIALKFDWPSIIDYVVLRPWHETFPIDIQQVIGVYYKKGLFDTSVIELFYRPFFETKDISLNITMREFYELTNIELHMFSLELNDFEIKDINYVTFPDLPIVKAVHMSCSLPGIMTPVCFDEKCFVDGGFISNYPIKFCVEKEKNVEEILGIQNIYTDSHTKNITDDSTMLDYIMHFIIKLITKVCSNTTYEGQLPYELKYETTLMTMEHMKEVLYSSDARQQLINKGIDAAKCFLRELELTHGTKEREDNEVHVTMENGI